MGVRVAGELGMLPSRITSLALAVQGADLPPCLQGLHIPEHES